MGFSLMETTVSATLLAILISVAARLMTAIDRAATQAPPESGWVALAAVAVAEDVREAARVAVSAKSLVIEAHSGRSITWLCDGSGLLRYAQGRLATCLPVAAAFSGSRGGVVVCLRLPTGPPVRFLVVPRSGTVAEGGT
ncbi:MAG: hypothetical protein H5T86_15035 [Armatimonadetes bacterium]|nr:hypothetical protein [Armatimonadota bacterium]